MATISWDVDPDDPTNYKKDMEFIELTEYEMIIFFNILGKLGDDTKLHLAKGIKQTRYENKWNKDEFNQVTNIRPVTKFTKDLW